jgi:hypothetical protein
MATTTFSGPIKAGTIRNTTGTTVGTDVANSGFVTMAQAAVISITGVQGINLVATIPANSKISAVVLNVTTANNDGTASTVQVGTSGDPNAFLGATSVQAAGVTFSDVMTSVSTDVGTTDIQVISTFSSTDEDGTAGVADVTVMYIQNTNLA